MSLNAKQQIFVQEYLTDKNATRAAKAAGYSEAAAHESGSRLLRNPEVRAAVEKGIELQTKKIEEKSGVIFTRAMWLRELKLIALSNMDDFVTIDEVEIYTDAKTKKPVMNITANAIATIKRRHRSLGRVIKKISETKNGIGIELHSKQGALDTLGRHYGWLRDEVRLDDTSKPKVILTMPTNGREAIQVKADKDESNGSD